MPKAKRPSQDAYIRALERDNAQLRDRVEELEREVAKHAAADEVQMLTPAAQFKLSKSEGAVFARLAASGFATKEQLIDALYAEKPEIIRSAKIIDVYVCKVRKKVERFGIVIETAHGRGYKIGQESLETIAAIQAGAAFNEVGTVPKDAS